jgi:hypothetical protein
MLFAGSNSQAIKFFAGAVQRESNILLLNNKGFTSGFHCGLNTALKFFYMLLK